MIDPLLTIFDFINALGALFVIFGIIAAALTEAIRPGRAGRMIYGGSVLSGIALVVMWTLEALR